VSCRIAVAVLGLAVAAGSAFAAADEHAAGHADGEGLWILARHALNLGILVFLLVRFALPALRDFMRQRSENLREQIGSAQRALEAAQRELADLRTQLQRADDEARELLVAAELAAQAEQPLAQQRARETADRLRDDARRVADQEIQRARDLLQGEAAQLATELAGELLRERLGPEDDRRLFDEFTARVGSSS
jgi:F-type H+-transporting ATPase subunit b